jgi:DNA mismatch repair protein MLH3
MFNDPLTLAQCEDLVASLAHTALPFQCAHGRPSVVPISHLHSRPRRVGPSAIDWSQVHTLLESSNNITVEHDSS